MIGAFFLDRDCDVKPGLDRLAALSCQAVVHFDQVLHQVLAGGGILVDQQGPHRVHVEGGRHLYLISAECHAAHRHASREIKPGDPILGVFLVDFRG